MSEPLTGIVTFLFTDIEGSTMLLRRLGDRYREVLTLHHGILRQAIGRGGGTEVRTEGDAFFVVFPSPMGAVTTAVDAQRGLAAASWPDGQMVRVRMGLHTGEAVLVGEDYMGIDIHLAARIAAAAHGGQVLVSERTRPLVERTLPPGVSLRDLGRHRLKDIERPAHLWDLVIAGLPEEFPEIRSLEARPTNLPIERTSFVGRERELAEVAGLLIESRLVTLTGPGGTGKTRLALRAAADQLDRFSDGVFFVDLSPVVDPELVASAIAQSLLIRDEPGATPLDAVADHIRDRHLLLVLDNAEQVIEAGLTVARLLEAAPRLTVLATSRIPFRISGERAYPVPPLALPGDQGVDVESLGRSEAVRLFTERAAALQPGFRLTRENAPAVTGIITRLDGLPLAIELAASRLNVLSPEGLLDRLGRRLAVLSGGARDMPERQRTLRGAIEWSHDLLGSGEQKLFARLAVFSGGWTLEGAEIVCGPGLELDVLNGLGTLVDSSMVRMADAGDGAGRFVMLETIREYATERLARSGEEPDLRRRHAEHVREEAERLDPGFFFRVAGVGKEQGARVRHLDRENANVRAALGWAAGGGDVVTGLRTAAALSWYWQHRGHFAHGRGWLERLLSLADAATPPALLVRALLALGDVTAMQPDRERAGRAYEDAVTIAREIEQPALLARSLLDLADVPTWEGEYDRAEAILRDGLASAEEAGDRAIESEIRALLARLDYYRGDFAAAHRPYQEAIETQREIGAHRLVAINVARLADVEVRMGELDAAERHYCESLRMVTEAGNDVITAVMLVYLAWVASRKGSPQRAARLIGAVDRSRDEIGGGPTRQAIPEWVEAEDEARRQLGDEAFERARTEGYATNLEEAVAYALERAG